MKPVLSMGWIDGEIDFITTSKYSASAENFKLMQYTGLKDKEGIMIFEGDIVKIEGNHIPIYKEVYYHAHAGFAGVHPFIDSGYHWSSLTCKVIGNVYENRDILKYIS